MKRFLLVLCVMMLTPTIVSAEITRKVIEKYPPISETLPGTPKTVIYSDSKGKEVAREHYDEQGNVIQTIGAIPDGIVNEYYENGALLAKYNYKNGKLEGLSKGYFNNNTLRGEWNYKNGLLNGTTREYYENGNVRYQLNYKNNERDGKCEVFLENGKPAVSWEYKDGMREGINLVYYDNGVVHFELNYKDDNRNGIAREYYPSGKLKAEYNYKGGVQEGTTKHYDENGKFISGRNHSVEEPRTRVEEKVKKTYQASSKEESENATLKIVAVSENAIGIDLTNSVPVRGVQFRLEGVKITEVRTTPRTAGFLAKFNEESGIVILASTSGDKIIPGTGLIAEIICDKTSSASLSGIIIAK